jgi:hypothetical protein
VHTYWTNAGAGVAPDPDWDEVGGGIYVGVLAQGAIGVFGDDFVDPYNAN